MEPQAVVNLNNKLREYQIQEKREVERILWELSQKLMPYTNSLHQKPLCIGTPRCGECKSAVRS